MSCSCQVHFKMPQMRVAPSLWPDGATELILDTSKRKQKDKQLSHHKMSNARVYLEGNWCQTDKKGPQPFVCESPRPQSFCTVSFFLTRFCRSPWKCVRRGRDPNTGSVCFQDFVFLSVMDACPIRLTFHHHKQEYRPLILKWTKEGSPSLAGAQHWMMGEGMRTFKKVFIR